MQMKNERKKGQTDGIFVYAKQEETYIRMRRECPECGNKEAMHWFSGISGEHAGIMRERTVEHLKCTKCSHTWTENS